MYDGPKTPAGKTFTIAAPERQASYISLGVNAPGKKGTDLLTQYSATSPISAGETMNVAPESSASLRIPVFRTVPAPIIRAPFEAFTQRSITEEADLEFIAISIVSRPEEIMASTSSSTGRWPEYLKIPNMGRFLNRRISIVSPGPSLL